jgi:hypothetical protein
LISRVKETKAELEVTEKKRKRIADERNEIKEELKLALKTMKTQLTNIDEYHTGLKSRLESYEREYYSLYKKI